ncbi:MAG TPA: bifunctional alpha,alpha-trehalose-phosphate synthase (UDP-forming)/trehalose-phosphatase [Oligoflexus sp.]|uniref:bifunctional alpha,alpha-trehalose-phosphate synthase (UDP-forming)/trehalose-phosphatase n=1 Tax=Oligoflexus sp. TaxID=1971216 RepID=UPI002D73AC88|nr:bifunctional alpha,alpha-trehalose-phosphate synthase (UDP-forming)/trehalose-phosphatase [Oligoflexus sp.]HYX34545.1 bifunctional alpha,alpha-trehalose-phosphate synthase (UDP-forming)/trehalose-phosphatase [Oligoflexus sp.]
MNRLFIVSHRLPFSAYFENDQIRLKASMGGLASGLLPLLGEDTVWLGWDGLSQKLTKAQKAHVASAFQERGCETVRLPIRAHHAFYNDVSNGVFWPLYHNQTGSLPLTLPHWADYQLINRLFAERLAELVRPGDTVWIQDYHLQLLPRMIRERNLGVSISFFLHVPFPPAEIFRMLPIREEILEGLLGADTIGFHTKGYVDHFKQAVEQIVSYPRVTDGLLVGGRMINVLAAPLGVDVVHWEEIAARQSGGTLVEAIDKMRQDKPDLRILFSVDRLDYTKGLPRKLLAFEKLLEKYPEWQGKITLIQIAPSSRDELAAYNRYKLLVEQMIGAINGRFGFPGYQPVQYFASAFSAEELGQAYGRVNIMLVTPLIDGMNLVAKEFIASRPDMDGVLILSEFAGAADELREALIVNPYDIDAAARTMHAALIMPESERQDRMKRLRDAVTKFSTVEWARLFSQGMGPGSPKLESVQENPFLRPDQLPQLASQLTPPLALFIDYDGTLFPIVRRPELAAPDSGLIMLLGQLGSIPGVEVHIVSGRRFDELFRWFHRLPLHIHGEHGGISYDPQTRQRSFLMESKRDCRPLQRAFQIFERHKSLNEGILIERKVFSTVLHYRMINPDAVDPLLSVVTEEIMSMEGAGEIEILRGKKNLEVRIKGISKARVIENRMAKDDPIFCVAIGDDRTDEDMFAAIGDAGLALGVGSSGTKAHFKLLDSTMVREFLRTLFSHLNTGAEMQTPTQNVPTRVK